MNDEERDDAAVGRLLSGIPGALIQHSTGKSTFLELTPLGERITLALKSAILGERARGVRLLRSAAAVADPSMGRIIGGAAELLALAPGTCRRCGGTREVVSALALNGAKVACPVCCAEPAPPAPNDGTAN